MKLLLISNSTNAGEEFLGYPKAQLAQFLAKNKVKKAAFVPYAAVTYSYDEYEAKVQKRFNDFGVQICSVHKFANPADAISKTQCVIVGGGNTFHLVKNMQKFGLMKTIRDAVLHGKPYIGWSAGSNVACPTMCTTNDMPIVQPRTMKTLNLIPFQINPHYLDAHPQGHAGETREQRILEYIAANHSMYVAGLREGCMFLIDGKKMSMIGPRPVRLFKYGSPAREIKPDDDFSFLLNL